MDNYSKINQHIAELIKQDMDLMTLESRIENPEILENGLIDWDMSEPPITAKEQKLINDLMKLY